MHTGAVADTDLEPDYAISTETDYTRATIKLVSRGYNSELELKLVNPGGWYYSESMGRIKANSRRYNYPTLLHMAGIGNVRSGLAIPSWTPDLSIGSDVAYLKPGKSDEHKSAHYAACGHITKTEISFDRRHTTLFTPAILLDTIRKLYRQPSSKF